MSKILVPVDFSETSIMALETALVLANETQQDLRIIHVQMTDQKRHYASGFIISHPSSEYSDSKEMLDGLMKKYESQYTTSGRFDYKILEGNVAEELINAAKYEQATFIVAGSHGVSGLSKSWIGGNAFKLISNATCPVLIIRPDMTFNKEFKKMVAPISINKSSRKKIPMVIEMAKLFTASVSLVGIQTSSLEAIFNRITLAVRQVERILTKNGVEIKDTHMLSGKESYDKLFEIARTDQADLLLCEVTNLGSFIADRLLRPELTKIINNSPCPVLAIPIAAE